MTEINEKIDNIFTQKNKEIACFKPNLINALKYIDEYLRLIEKNHKGVYYRSLLSSVDNKKATSFQSKFSPYEFSEIAFLHPIDIGFTWEKAKADEPNLSVLALFSFYDKVLFAIQVEERLIILNPSFSNWISYLEVPIDGILKSEQIKKMCEKKLIEVFEECEKHLSENCGDVK